MTDTKPYNFNELRWLSRREATNHARNERDRAIACDGKRSYPNRHAALQHSSWRRRNTAHLYCCDHCGKWHVS